MSEVTLPDLVGFEELHGIKVCQIGEDGETYVALGHHDPRHALSAFNGHAKRVCGLTNLLDDWAPGDRQRWQKLRERTEACWAVLKEHCDEYGNPEHDDDCWECREIEEAGWWLDWGAEKNTPSAFPIMALVL